MRDSVSSAFKSFNTKFEGYLTFMYGDVKNLVKTGMGNLIDPIGTALSLPWVNTDGSAATQQQITDAWNAVKARTDLTSHGGAAYKSVTTIRLTDAGIDQLIQQRLKSNESTLQSSYPGYDDWPADAQMAILSMAWAMGPAFKFPTFKGQVNADPPDFTSAATSSHMNDTGNAGLVPRNAANQQLFLNAADVLKYKADPDKLYYPGAVPQTSTTTTAAPGTTTTAPPPTTTTAAPETTTSSAPATTTAAPAQTTTAAPATTTAAPAQTTTVAPGSSTTASPAASTTAAPDSSTTAGATGDPPTVTGSISIDPDDGTEQNPQSYQVAESVKLKLKWSSTNADSVDIAGVGAGLAASGEQDIPTANANYSITATGKTGKSDPFDLEVHTHKDGEVVSAHIDLGAGVAAIVSFTANKGNASITSATVGDTITLIAIVSDATETVKLNGNDAALTELPNGQKQAQLDVTIDANADGNFDCQALKDGAVAQDFPQHIDIVPAPATSTTAAPTTTAAPGTTSTAEPATTTTAAPASTTTAGAAETTTAGPTTPIAPTTTLAPATTSTASASAPTTTIAPTTTAAPSTTTTAPATTSTAAPGTTTTSSEPDFAVSDFQADFA